jgi:hypothetical protein
MKHLSLTRICGGPDFGRINLRAEVLDMREDDVCFLAVELVVLSAEDRGDVYREADVDSDVVEPGIFVHG